MKEVLPLTTTDRIVTIAVDVQNDFCPGGALGVNEGDEVVSPLNRVFNYTRTHNGDVVATRDWHPDQTPHFNDWPNQEEAGIWPRHCVAGTEGAEFHPDLNVVLTDTVINKGMGQTDGYSGFEGKATDGTTIEQIIQPKTARERVAVVLGGLATDYCDLATALDAAELAKRINEARQGVIEVFAMTDAMKAVNINPDDEKNALDKMEAAGITLITSEDVLRNRIKVEI